MYLEFSTGINAVYVSYIETDSYVAATETEMLNILDWSRISRRSGTPLSLLSYTCTRYASLLNGHNTNKLVKECVERLRSLKPFSVSLTTNEDKVLPALCNKPSRLVIHAPNGVCFGCIYLLQLYKVVFSLSSLN